MIDNTHLVAIIYNVKAQLLYRYRQHYSDGAIMEVVVWRLPRPVPGSVHPYKYRLFYGYPGQRLVGYDNERGQGGRETLYRFTTPENN